jgi:omega-hydroxy-beta-dihydromenaquinone-9 sulfotransferase
MFLGDSKSRCDMSVTQRKLIFITGASRSGTTLLSFVLRNHREVFGLKELQYFGEAWDPRESQRRFTRNQAIAAVAVIFARQERGILAAKVGASQRQAATDLIEGLGTAGSDPAAVFAAAVHSLAQAAGKPIPCEQTPRYIFYARALLDLYPAAHIVHIVRDPRAVMASQKKRWQRRRLAADGVMVSRYQSLRVWVNYHPYTVARLWSRATSAALLLAGHPRATLIRFEDLVQKPETTVRELCSRLQLSYDDRMLDVGQINSSHQSSVGGVRRGLHATAVDKWREVLTPTETAIAERYSGSLMHRFGYESSAPGRVDLVSEFAQRLSYLAHLAGVVLVNPHRAYVQGKALLRRRAPADSAAATGTVASDSDPAE